METKGVGDAIRAISTLRARRRNVALTIIGRGNVEQFESLAVAQGVGAHVLFLGPKIHKEVLAAMRENDAVLVPSHWAYPESLPMALYESLCTRTPLLTSDRQMFALRIRDGENAIVLPECNPEGFAACVEKLMDAPDLYTKLSVSSEIAAETIYVR